MTKSVGQARSAPEQSDEPITHAEEHPRGTLVIMLVYLVLIIALWGLMFLTMLERS